ncbi:hypothetical protein L6164_016802 [Bauhinia variegata]|uniref:Uncharacterized protein n=1 Tax=Bauhinia variegata TaxID=167791 RepID=A0ACB9N7V2_BAUVA|nr:hypothetical protein L6164_016802 [Bauhinia variegata]
MQGLSQPPMQKNQEQSHNQRAASTSTQPQQESNQSERYNETKGKEKVANQKSNLPRKRKPNASGAKKTSIAWEHFEKLPDVKEPTATLNDGLKDMQDSIFNIRNAVRFVRSSPSRLAKFKDCVNFASLPSNGPVCLDVPTRLVWVAALGGSLKLELCQNLFNVVEIEQAFNAGTSVLYDSPKPNKESIMSTLELQMDNGQQENWVSIDLGQVSKSTDNDLDQSVGSDKFPAPSIPQLNQGARLLDDGACQE